MDNEIEKLNLSQIIQSITLE